MVEKSETGRASFGKESSFYSLYRTDINVSRDAPNIPPPYLEFLHLSEGFPLVHTRHCPTELHLTDIFFTFFFFLWYISLGFSHSSLVCALLLQFPHPTLATSSSNSSHHFHFGLSLLPPFPPSLVQRTFF